MSIKFSPAFEGLEEESAIRRAEVKFKDRNDGVIPINVSSGNVKLPLHPDMQERVDDLGNTFKGGIPYSPTEGLEETQQAYRNLASLLGYNGKSPLFALPTNGAQEVMQLAILGLCSQDRPFLIIEPAYTNYLGIANLFDKPVITLRRDLNNDGRYTEPPIDVLEKIIEVNRPGLFVVVSPDNPSGKELSIETLINYAKLCVKYNVPMLKDGAYFGLTRDAPTRNGLVTPTLLAVTDNDVDGIEGLEMIAMSGSKMFNIPGLRAGALLTSNEEIYKRFKAAYSTLALCANVFGQHVMGALAHWDKEKITSWLRHQQRYYTPLMDKMIKDFKDIMPGIIVSEADGGIYMVVDVRNLVPKIDGQAIFSSNEFANYASAEGTVKIGGSKYTLLFTPMEEYFSAKPAQNPGSTQVRIALVETPPKLDLVPQVFSNLFYKFMSLQYSQHPSK